MFQSTRPAWGATIRECCARFGRRRFNPRAPRGARRYKVVASFHASMFQSTRPAWGATATSSICLSLNLFQSTRPAWGATTLEQQQMSNNLFQSTRPAWGATSKRMAFQIPKICFNPRAPRGARRCEAVTASAGRTVSIHAPRVGRDCSTVAVLVSAS